MEDIKLKEKIESLVDPSLQKSFKTLNAIETFFIDDEGIVTIVIKLFNPEKDHTQLRLSIIKLVKIEFQYKGIKIEFIKHDTNLDMKHTITYIGIASGKGGVGKSTVTSQLAYAFRDLGHQVGIIDADIYGASIPSILEVEDIAAIEEDMNLMIPIEKEGIEIISTEFFMSKEKPVMWRGPMLGKMLTEFIQSVKWKEDTSIILIDLPPGTGDVALDIQKLIPQASMIVVTTPHPNASMVAVKAGLGAKQMGHKMLGVIENMSYFEHPTTHEKFPIFGAGGGETVATMLNVPLLGQVPIYSGESFIDKHDKIKTIYHDIASKIEVNHV